MVKIPPYAPSAGWYGRWLYHLMEGSTGADAIISSNRDCNISERNLARCLLESRRGEPLVLSLAIEGGAKKLKLRGSSDHILLSEHGNWRKNHLGAIDALYGKYPFYDHLADSLRNIYNDAGLTSLRDFNSALHELLAGFILNHISMKSLNNLWHGNVLLSERGKEIAALINPDLSVIDALMKFGPETILALPASFDY